eukprot:TRINITY_DN4014_c0_g1_i1.p1 TRINITY_DN4014_c0_g1~~TRINITY_DN4014_c0_g1_i1.p1  ORF type:complete len:253 (+),score=35.69 TRINITY_DN4014_c0_g1_i1:64-822(+)
MCIRDRGQQGLPIIINLQMEPEIQLGTFSRVDIQTITGFLLRCGKEEEYNENQYLHSLLGLLKVPLLGKYSRSEYEFFSVKSIVDISLNINKSLKRYEIRDKQFSSNFNLPSDILQILIDVPEKIPLNNQKNESDEEDLSHKKSGKGKGSKKGKSTFIKKMLEGLTFCPSQSVRFFWIIYFNDLPTNVNKVGEKKRYLELNIVNHTWLFPKFSFMEQKRSIRNIPSCILLPSSGVKSATCLLYTSPSPRDQA